MHFAEDTAQAISQNESLLSLRIPVGNEALTLSATR